LLAAIVVSMRVLLGAGAPATLRTPTTNATAGSATAKRLTAMRIGKRWITTKRIRRDSRQRLRALQEFGKP
jgi:hypothetical protein